MELMKKRASPEVIECILAARLGCHNGTSGLLNSNSREVEMILSGEGIYNEIKKKQDLIKGYDLPSSFAQAITDKSQLQPASFDLSVGKIYLPGVKEDDEGGVNHPLTWHKLPRGSTAVILTKEELHLPDYLAAFGFCPSDISFKGLLMTNPGHVDPGYDGNMRFTVINMGSEPFELREGLQIATLLFFKIEAESPSSWRKNNPSLCNRPITKADLSKLSVDFLDVEERAKNIAQSTVYRSDRLFFFSTLLLSLLAVLVAIFLPLLTDRGLKEKIATLEGSIAAKELEYRVKVLEDNQHREQKNNPTQSESGSKKSRTSEQ